MQLAEISWTLAQEAEFQHQNASFVFGWASAPDSPRSFPDPL